MMILPLNNKNSFHTVKIGEAMPKEKQEYVIQSVAKGLNLLKVFTNTQPELGLVEISSQIGLNPSSTYRLLVTLEDSGFIEQDTQTGRYRLGLACLRLASAFQVQNDLRKIALPVMQQLRDVFKETVHLARLVGSEVIYLEKLVALLPIGIIGVPPGGRAPAYCTALGKVMLAYQPVDEVRQMYAATTFKPFTVNTIRSVDQLLPALEEIRRCGYAFDNEEIDIGVKCVAAPIHNSHHHSIGALSVSGPKPRMDVLVRDRGLIDALVDASRQISEHLTLNNY
jgi:IclR family transcriptional regulator, KDG regulon repressor